LTTLLLKKTSKESMRIYGKFRFKDSLDQRLMNVSPFKDFGQNETCELGQIWTLLS